MTDPAPVRYAGVEVPLELFNTWVQNPTELQDTIGRFQALYVHLNEQATRLRGERALIREMSEELTL
jgi:hypothetical protein